MRHRKDSIYNLLIEHEEPFSIVSKEHTLGFNDIFGVVSAETADKHRLYNRGGANYSPDQEKMFFELNSHDQEKFHRDINSLFKLRRIPGGGSAYEFKHAASLHDIFLQKAMANVSSCICGEKPNFTQELSSTVIRCEKCRHRSKHQNPIRAIKQWDVLIKGKKEAILNNESA